METTKKDIEEIIKVVNTHLNQNIVDDLVETISKNLIFKKEALNILEHYSLICKANNGKPIRNLADFRFVEGNIDSEDKEFYFSYLESCEIRFPSKDKQHEISICYNFTNKFGGLSSINEDGISIRFDTEYYRVKLTDLVKFIIYDCLVNYCDYLDVLNGIEEDTLRADFTIDAKCAVNNLKDFVVLSNVAKEEDIKKFANCTIKKLESHYKSGFVNNINILFSYEKSTITFLEFDINLDNNTFMFKE